MLNGRSLHEWVGLDGLHDWMLSLHEWAGLDVEWGGACAVLGGV